MEKSKLDKVIEGLRHCACFTSGWCINPCDGCEYQGDIHCADNLKHDAIDLILDMQAELDNICQMGDSCNNKAVKCERI